MTYNTALCERLANADKEVLEYALYDKKVSNYE